MFSSMYIIFIYINEHVNYFYIIETGKIKKYFWNYLLKIGEMKKY